MRARNRNYTTNTMHDPSLPEPVTRSQILFYQAEDGKSRIEVRLDEGTVWLTQALIAELYQITKQNVSLHIRNILDEEELSRTATVKEYLTVRVEGPRSVNQTTGYHNPGMIPVIGYRVRSRRGTRLRHIPLCFL
jgi:hypothetical protein